jgi:hypothetical protein
MGQYDEEAVMCEIAPRTRAGASPPRWAVVYAVAAVQLTVLAIVEIASPPNPIRIVARCVLVLGTFLGLAWWVHSNRAALDLQQWCECAPRTVTVRVVPSRRPTATEPDQASYLVTAESDPLVHA